MLLYLEKKFLILELKNFLCEDFTILQLSRILKCAPIALENWLNDENNNELNEVVYEYLLEQMHYNNTLKIPFIRTSTFKYIESLCFSAFCSPGFLYILHGGPGLGKTIGSEKCAELYSEKIAYINTVSKKTIFLNEMLLDKALFIFDNITNLTNDIANQTTVLLNQKRSVFWIFDTINFKHIRIPLSSKAMLYLIPGIDGNDYATIFNALDINITEIAKEEIKVLTIPSISRLIILLSECYKIAAGSIIDPVIIKAAYHTVFNYPGW